jgi:nitrous oxidase accessory protein
MVRRLALALVCLGLPAAVVAARLPGAPAPRDAAEIQALLDAAAEGSVVVPPPGHYVGHVDVTKPVVLDGKGQVTIDAGGVGTVLTIRTNDATVRNLHLVGTGSDHNSEDAGIQVRGDNNVVKDNRIEDALFGIDLQKSYHNIIRRNHISSKALELGMRGDSIRLWYSDDNLLEDNEIHDSRDFVLWYAKRNRITGTHATGGRYGLHFMFAADNIIEKNVFTDNSVGMSLMYNQGDIIRDNVISHSVGATGTCISMKEASAITITGNEIVYCATALSFDVSPFQPDTHNIVENNRIAYNDIAISFISDWERNDFRNNRMESNITEVAVFGGGSAKRNTWDGNFWDGYEGFDRDHDGVGDTSHRIYNYAGRVWMDVPNTRFFKGTAILEVLDFLDRLAPFSEPTLMLEDAHPRIRHKEKTS